MSDSYHDYPRDLIGYGSKPPHAQWPGQARVALQFVLNYEEGAENSVLHGDPGSETFLSEMIGVPAFPMRHMSMESLYEYGSRAGLWRVLRMFEERKLPLTVFAVSMALKRNPEACAAFQQLGHEIACHGLRWISYQNIDEAIEREHIAEALQIIKDMTGVAAQGWYTGRDSPNTRKLVVEHGGLTYDADYYGDDLPFWKMVGIQQDGFRKDVPHLVVPYTLDTNDMRFAATQGFNSGEQFFDYLKDAFDVLYKEGDPDGLNSPKMLSIGLHCRLIGRPARIAALGRFLDYVQSHDKVWITRRIDIANHWMTMHPYKG
jgi:allantoinase